MRLLLICAYAVLFGCLGSLTMLALLKGDRRLAHLPPRVSVLIWVLMVLGLTACLTILAVMLMAARPVLG